MEKELAKSLRNAGKDVQYDEQCKKVLSNKVILAWILKGTAKEFKDLELDTIVSSIEGEPEVSAVKVNPGETNQERITGSRNEDKVPGEGVIYYDIRFYAYVPNGKKPIKIIINVEAQKDYYPGYDIVTRGIFYASRMISAQLGTEFTIPNYDGIQKVYSIWICMNSPKKVGNAIAEYSIRKKDWVAGIPDKESAYDKLAVVIVTLNEKSVMDEALLQMLNVILSAQSSYEEKAEKLTNQFHINLENNLGKELDLMCNLSGYVKEKGREEGREEGRMLAKKEMVLNLKKRGFPEDQIVQIVGESEVVIREWLESEMLLAK